MKIMNKEEGILKINNSNCRLFSFNTPTCDDDLMVYVESYTSTAMFPILEEDYEMLLKDLKDFLFFDGDDYIPEI